MKQKIAKIFKIFISKSFLEFCILGGINTFNAAFISHIAHLFIQENAAAFLGYIVSLSIAFFLNCKIIFKKNPNIRSYFRFLVSYIPNFIIYVLVTFITINTLNLPQFWATVVAAMTGGPLTFIIIKMYAFGKGGSTEDF